MVAHGIRGDGLEAACLSETRSEGTYGTRSSQQVCPGTGGRSMEERVVDVSFAMRASALEAAVRGRRGVVGQRTTGITSPSRPISGAFSAFQPFRTGSRPCLGQFADQMHILHSAGSTNIQLADHHKIHMTWRSPGDGLWASPPRHRDPSPPRGVKLQARSRAAPPNDAR